MTQIMEPQTLPRPHQVAREKQQTMPPAIILGGRANALSVARNIGRLGAAVYILNDDGAFAGYSRYARQIHVKTKNGKDQAQAWGRFSTRSRRRVSPRRDRLVVLR